jgi:hypothetical protein
MVLDHYTVLHFGMCHAAAQLVQSMAWAVGPTSQSVMHARARSPATKMMNFRLGLSVVLPKSSVGAINFIWTTYLGNYHYCSTLADIGKIILIFFILDQDHRDQSLESGE